MGKMSRKRWLTADDVVRLALAGYYEGNRRAVAEMLSCREEGDPPLDDSPIEAFYVLEQITGEIVARINQHAMTAGVNRPEAEDWGLARLPDGVHWPERRRAWAAEAIAG